MRNQPVSAADEPAAQSATVTGLADLRTPDPHSLRLWTLSRLYELAMGALRTEAYPDFQAILEAAIEAHRADFGILLLADPAMNKLSMVVNAGFDDAMLATGATDWTELAIGTCSGHDRILAEDADTDARFVAAHSMFQQIGVRSVITTPILSRGGTLLGVIAVQFRAWHKPSACQLELADLCASHAAEAIENANRRRLSHENETWLLSATRTGKLGIWDWDIVANRVSWSESLYAIHGVTREEFPATVEGFAGLVHPDDRATVSRAIERALELGQPYELEFRAVRPGGEVIWLFTNAVVVREGGKPVRMLGATMDITAYQRAKTGMRNSQERFSRFMKHLPGLAWIKNVSGHYVFANDAAHKAFQTTPAELYGKTDAEVFPPETAEQFDENDRRALRSEAGLQTIETLEHEDGSVHHSLVSKFSIPGTDGRPRWIGGMAIDITDRMRVEESLRASEQRFRTLADHAPVGIFQSAPNGESLFVNEGWCAMAGLTPQQAQGQGWLNAVHPEDRERIAAGWADAVQGGAPSATEFRFLKPDGTTTWLQGDAVPLRNPDGELGGYIGTVVDITERKAAEIALRESEQRFRHMADHAPVMIWVTDADGSCTFLGKTWYEFTGCAPETSLGFGWIEAVHADDRAPAREAFLAANGEHRAFRIEYRLQNRDGEYRWVIDAAMPRFAEDGKFLGFIGSVIDITDRKEVETELRDADRRKDEFLAVLAHELRNPLAPIRTGLELIRLAGDDRAAIEEVRSTMDRQSQQMVRLIDDLLDVSRITRGTFELRKCRIELSAVIESAAETARPVIEDMGHELKIEIPKQPILLEADPTRLAQVISNLLNNAAKYMERGGTIELRAERQDSTAIVRVKDSGIGIPAEMIDRIFDMFTQVDGSLERSHGGLGIGLTLVKRLVEMHGGSVEARSAGTDQGSEFIVRLPAVVGLLRERVQTSGDKLPAVNLRRILVVDDNETAATVLAMLLKALGNDVRTAFDGLTAIDIAEQFRPDIVLLDIGMPKLNGYETARRIRQQPWGKDMVLAALTGWGQEEDRRRTREAGFDHHFVKPVEPDVLQKLIAEHEPAAR